ncbi:hypothetical protein Moror_1855 [Moniliophthora roreri MCA 2997]|uniref:Uncharacterized protein n=1 Tax=Moniliophthora roreri (strain MCA 2997) TaxID=1381753 RepID=V2WLJ7_MONRO|nr:hypothetical protein Moror_1855 [Moniliophthora roreri MCA 2997]
MVTINTTPSTVLASLSYFSPPTDGSKPRLYNFTPPEGVPAMNYDLVKHTVPIENVRGKEDTLSLDTSGFQFVKHTSAHKAFNDDAEIKKDYYPESIELLKKLTGASKVVLFNHTLRRRRGQGDNGYSGPKKRGAATSVHVDQTPLAAHNRVRLHLSEDEAAERLKRRFQIINLWRPISHPALDWPLAVCDYRSVNLKEDLVPVDLVYPDRVGETFNVKYNPEHKWKYLQGITPEEVILQVVLMILSKTEALRCLHLMLLSRIRLLPREALSESPLRLIRALVFYDD